MTTYKTPSPEATKAAEEILKPCCKCGTVYAVSPWQLRRRHYLCRPCLGEQQKEYRRNRKKRGLPKFCGDPLKKAIATVKWKASEKGRLYKLRRYQRLKNNPEQWVRILARNTARRAILDGRLKRQPCEMCGHPSSHAHHKDYSRPIDVQWLCEDCHLRAHGKTPWITSQQKHLRAALSAVGKGTVGE